MRWGIYLFVLPLWVLINVSCSSSYRFVSGMPELPAHLQPVDPVKIRLVQKLRNEQIEVIQQGQYYLISIPAALLFAQHSPVIVWPGYAYLNDVACYIKAFRKVEVEVNAYDTCCDKHQRILAMTRLRASNVADYLISQQIDSRIVFTRGMGNDKPIMKTTRKDSYYANSRVEVLFKEEII